MVGLRKAANGGTRALALLVLWAASAGCTPVREFAPQGLSVRVDAAEEVRAAVDDVEVRVESRTPEANSWRLLESQRFTPDPGDPGDWPLAFSVKSYDPGATYQVTATARDEAEAVMIQARTISEPEPNRSPELRLRFDRECLRPSMLCGRTRTCSFGKCVDAREPLADEAPAGDDPVMQTDAVSMTDAAGTSAATAECSTRQAGERFCDSKGIMYECQADQMPAIKACSENEHCVDIAREVRCDCLPGFVADSQGCTEPSDCRDQGGCDPLTTCQVRAGERFCGACPPGHSGNGETGCAPLLSDLSVSPGDLEPAFDPNITDYSVRVPVLSSQMVIKASTLVDAELEIDRQSTSFGTPWTSGLLPSGKSELPMTLRARSGVRTDYRISVERAAAQTYLKPSEVHAGDWFGAFVAAYEDTIVIGAPNESVGGLSNAGAAYVFVREGSGWRQQHRLVATEPRADDLFGTCVAIWEDQIAIGAPANIFSSLGAATRPGHVQLFRRVGDAWQLDETVRLSDSASGGNGFGFNVAVRDTTLLVGAPLEDSGARDSGGAYVFERDGSRWLERQLLKASSPQAESHFGTMLGMDDATIAVSAWQENVNGETSAGALYTYQRGVDGWSAQERVLAPAPRASAMFGAAVIVRGDLLVVSAPHNPAQSSSNRSGEVHIYERNGAEYQILQTLEAPEPSVGDRFGNHVGLTETSLVVGAPGPGRNGAAEGGSAYLYARAADGFIRTTNLQPSHPDADDYFGYAVALTDHYVAITALREDGGSNGIDSNAADNTREDSGAVYLFE